MITWTGKRIIKLSLYKQINTEIFWKIGYEHLFFFFLYILSLYYCYNTIGEQYYEALLKAEEQNINIFDENEKLRYSAESFFLNDKNNNLNNNNNNDNNNNSDGITFKVPSKWLPGFWASISFGIVIILHCLMVLGQRWSVAFRCLIRYRQVQNIQNATHAHVTPPKHQGKEELVEIIRTNNSIYFEFHRRKYVYDSQKNCFVKVRCRVDYPISHYLKWQGIPNEKIIHQLKELHGPNKFQMSSPAFIDLYIEQITSPFTVFQIFCIILWMLDDYWQYSLFTLFMICTFEATSVFSRLKSLSTLKGMGNEPRPIYTYRQNKWIEISTEELLPGDIFSLTKHSKDDIIPCDAVIIRGGAVVNEATLTGESVPQMKDGISQSISTNDSIIDLQTPVSIKGQHKVHALFGGTRVLQVTSVATRTAEFEEDQVDEAEIKLNENIEEKVDVNENSNDNDNDEEENEDDNDNDDDNDEIPEETVDSINLSGNIVIPPDAGCLCYCTRTGFSSSQGKLVRMIEHSQASVRGDTRDTVLLLLLLLVFALSASGYVLYHGMQDGRRSKYQLLLHCILIVTSVIPPELPMQTALAVNASLMTLMKMQIFCTEPFRVPIAGKVDVCVFDKTGTLTTDELVAVGTVTPNIRANELKRLHDEALVLIEKTTKEAQKLASNSSINNQTINQGNNNQRLKQQNNIQSQQQSQSQQQQQPILPTISAATAGMIPIVETSPEVTFVLGTCHSLVLIDGKVAGDPLEVASLKAIKWEIPPNLSDCARPKPDIALEHPLKISTLDNSNLLVNQVKILSRHHFNSKLQRMSVVVKVKGDSPGYGFVVVKGSPEALSQMCTDCPSDFHLVAGDLAKRGMRVIALGLRRLNNSEEIQTCCDSRAAAEQHLRFVGFVAFTCRVRKDTAMCIQNLRLGGNIVIMATGDAMLTAVHVAQEVGITTISKKGILIFDIVDNNIFQWTDYESGKKSEIEFSPDTISKVAINYDLCITGANLNKLVEKYSSVCSVMDKFVVYARMRPDEKEQVILNMKNHGKVCLMCGDGANDVGALKQAHVGVALLSGFGDLNVSREKGQNDSKDKKSQQLVEDSKKSKPVSSLIMMTDKDLEDLKLLKVPDLKVKLRQIGVEPDDYPEYSEKNDLITLFKKKYEEKSQENREIKRQKELMKMSLPERQKFLADERKAMALKQQQEFQKEYEELLAKGESWAMFKAMQNAYKKTVEEQKKRMGDANTLTGSAGRMAAMMDDLENMEDMQLPMVKIGDASVASPFTSKMPSIKGTVDIIRQGRCTLVTTIQMYEILALNCLINAYSLSVLHLDGVKYGDRQMTCLGILMSVSFVTISRSKPLDQLSSVRPLGSVFHPALFLSLIGQFVMHILTMYLLVKQAKTYLPEDYAVDLDKEFKPNIVNSVVFLVTAVQQVSVFVVNLKGPPFMGGLTENTPLLWSLVVTFVGTFLCASESIPQLNLGLQLEPFPSVAFRNTVLFALILDVSCAFLWDRFLLGLFAFPVLKASLEGTTRKEIIAILRVVVIVSVIVYWLATQDYTQIMEELERQEAEAKLAEVGLQSQQNLDSSGSSNGNGWFGQEQNDNGNMFERTLSKEL